MFKSDPVSFTKTAVAPDSLKVTVSPTSSNASSFTGMYPMVVSFIFSTTTPINSVFAPSNLSPIIKSAVV